MPLPTRTLARNVLRAHRASSDAEVLALALKAHESGQRYLAYELLRAAPRAVNAAKPAHVRRLASAMTSWSEVDCFGCFFAGVAWRGGRISDAEIARFAASKDRWQRRAALVATVPLNARSRGASFASGDAPRTLAVCALLLDDRDQMVVKALSWALRELAKRDARAVRQFLSEHGGRLAARVCREVTNKLTTGRKSAVASKVRLRH
jgi:3-methyladenine DNA glycosylase AlkD